ncbi:SGNH/GDSL hydrolase family protein [Curtobacterium sp. MCBD17_021]|uniref:SGNH/GDSL hydrolase family protein n=1 Tax=Curtobacterium sp. MCBD17_021 TaxID=2175665 RepID=UPI000DA9D425|nr:SGNH/GDSL hydrolase family protein [Curtobacterium sp. MCBD17_021]PZE66879.1 hypothetical protein DEI83_06105 [Curtobacterium sp. MCBD17_021]
MGNGFVGWFARSYKAIIVVLVAIMAVMLVVLAMQHVEGSARATNATAHPIPTFTSTPRVERVKVGFVGDSYTGGTGASTKQKSYASLLASDRHWITTVSACGGGGYVNPGNCGSPYADHLDTVIDASPSIVIVAGGRNDIQFPIDDISANANTLLQRIKTALPQAKVYVTSPVFDDDQPSAKLGEIQEALKTVAASAGATYVDVGEPLVGHANLITTDGVHPNDAGHAALAAAFDKALPRD